MEFKQECIAKNWDRNHEGASGYFADSLKGLERLVRDDEKRNDTYGIMAKNPSAYFPFINTTQNRGVKYYTYFYPVHSSSYPHNTYCNPFNGVGGLFGGEWFNKANNIFGSCLDCVPTDNPLLGARITVEPKKPSMKFNEKNVVSDSNKQLAHDGDTGYFSDTLKNLKGYVETGTKTCYGILSLSLQGNVPYPFINKTTACVYRFFYPTVRFDECEVNVYTRHGDCADAFCCLFKALGKAQLKAEEKRTPWTYEQMTRVATKALRGERQTIITGLGFGHDVHGIYVNRGRYYLETLHDKMSDIDLMSCTINGEPCYNVEYV